MYLLLQILLRDLYLRKEVFDLADILSSVTELPRSCKSAADHMARELAKEDAFASLSDSCCQKLTKLEQELQK